MKVGDKVYCKRFFMTGNSDRCFQTGHEYYIHQIDTEKCRDNVYKVYYVAIIINKEIFDTGRFDDIIFYEYFNTVKEIRKLKLENLNEI